MERLPEKDRAGFVPWKRSCRWEMRRKQQVGKGRFEGGIERSRLGEKTAETSRDREQKQAGPMRGGLEG